MYEYSDEIISITVKIHKKTKIDTKTDLSEEPNKDQQLVKMFCVDLGPYYILESYGFREFIKNNISNYTLPSIKKFSKELIPAEYKRVRSIFMETLKSIPHVAISIETWKLPEVQRRNARKLWTTTIHFVDQGQFVSQNLFTIEANPKTEKNIATAIQKKLVEWEVLKKIVCFITNKDGKDKDPIRNAVVNELRKPHVYCVRASINLIIKETFEENIFKKKLETPQKDNSESPRFEKRKDALFNWHNLYTMLKNISDKNAGDFNEDEMKRACGELAKLLKPFEDFNDALASQQYLTLSRIIPLISDLRFKITKCSTSTALAAERKTKLMEVIDKYFGQYEGDIMVAKATIMDPRFKQIDCFTKKITDFAVLKNIVYEFKEYVNLTCEQPNPFPSTSNSQSEENGNPAASASNYNHTSRKDMMSYVNLEVKQYITQPALDQAKDPFKFWKDFNDSNKSRPVNLYIMSQKYLCIPATAKPIDTIAGEFPWKKNDNIDYNERRTSLDFINVDKMLFLHSYYSRNR